MGKKALIDKIDCLDAVIRAFSDSQLMVLAKMRELIKEQKDTQPKILKPHPSVWEKGLKNG